MIETLDQALDYLTGDNLQNVMAHARETNLTAKAVVRAMSLYYSTGKDERTHQMLVDAVNEYVLENEKLTLFDFF